MVKQKDTVCKIPTVRYQVCLVHHCFSTAEYSAGDTVSPKMLVEWTVVESGVIAPME